MHVVEQQKHTYNGLKAMLLIKNSMKNIRITQRNITNTLYYWHLQTLQIPWRIYKLQGQSL